jgi:selenide, water dikinase
MGCAVYNPSRFNGQTGGTRFGRLVGETVKLTAAVKAAGCAAKLAPGTLEALLRRLPRQQNSRVLVGFETSDDAGIYRLSQDLALVQTVDFFTPIVDDPFSFGQIAATNALSDVYAMGGRPISALSIVAFPEKGDLDLLEQILRGGLDKMIEADCTVIGGHSIRDDDMKFGYAVTGVIHPARVWKNVGACPGDALLLTKPLGVGVISTALKQSSAPPESVAAAMVCMKRLNRDAAAALMELIELDNRPAEHTPAAVHAVTDVTGFGLLGHAREMAIGSGVSLEIDHTAIEYLPGAITASRGGFHSAGLRNNREFVGDCVRFAATIPQEFQHLLFDPQTSGGLLMALDPRMADAALSALATRNVAARRIGRVVERRSPLMEVI